MQLRARPRTIGLAALSMIAALATGDAQASNPLATQGTIPRRYAITRVFPRTTNPGDTIEVSISPALDSASWDASRVSIGGLAARKAGIRGGGRISVEVPRNLTPADSMPELLVEIGAQELRYRGLRTRPLPAAPVTAAEEPKIVTVIPTFANRGDTITILTNVSGDSSWHLTIAGREAEHVGGRANELRVIVPRNLALADSFPEIILLNANQSSTPFTRLYVRPPFLAAAIRSPTFQTGAVITAMLLVLVVVTWRQWRRDHLVVGPVTVSLPPPSLEASPVLPTPDVPPELVAAAIPTECVLFAGSGLSAQAGYPTWGAFVQDLLQWAISSGEIERDFGRSLESALARGNIASVADSLVNAVKREALIKKMLEVYSPGSRKPPDVYRGLSEIGFCAALTTNFDGLLERTLGGKDVPVFTPADSQVLLEAFSKRRLFLLKLYGTLEKPDSVMIAPAEFRAAVTRDRSFASFMENMLASRSFLFVGASLEGIQDYLDGLAIRVVGERQHFALAAVDDESWKAQADVLQRRYRIKVLPYSAGSEHASMAEFIESLRQKVVQQRPARSQAEAQDDTRMGNPLRRVVLENIGPFDKLDLALDEHWTVLLGDNGVGKSTILKAIALALCGRDAQRYASRLIKVRQTTATITLYTDRNSYVTKLFARDGEADVEAGGRAFEGEGWLVLGFSPIRIVTWDRPKDNGADRPTRPTANDMLPLVRGDIDPRMNNVKQWLMTLDHNIKDEASRGIAAGKYVRLRDEFVRALGTLLGGMKVDLKSVDASAGKITVTTADGDVPIEAVSQGTASLLGWVGVLMQRLFEVFDDDPMARKRFAIVLLDEIDAHMHPAWQQALVSRLSLLFPNVQFVATTHSPLIVGGMGPENLARFVRDASGQVKRVAVEQDTAMGRTDQVLTGDLFGLQSTLDDTTSKRIREYRALLSRNSQSKEDAKRISELETELAARIPSANPQLGQRRAQELVQAVLTDELIPSPETRKLVSDRVGQLLKVAESERTVS